VDSYSRFCGAYCIVVALMADEVKCESSADNEQRMIDPDGLSRSELE